MFKNIMSAIAGKVNYNETSSETVLGVEVGTSTLNIDGKNGSGEEVKSNLFGAHKINRKAKVTPFK